MPVINIPLQINDEDDDFKWRVKQIALRRRINLASLVRHSLERECEPELALLAAEDAANMQQNNAHEQH